jgi:cytoskeletal protein RodZ
MKLKPKSSKKKIIFLILGIIALLVAGVVGYALYNTQQKNTKDTNETSDFKDANPLDEQSEKQQQSYEDQKKEEQADNHDNTPPDATLEITFTSVGQMDATVRVRAEINALLEGGTCTLTLTKDTSTLTKTAATYPTANASTCQGFDIPTTELSAGTWNITLEVTKDGQSGRATTTVDVL